MRRSDVWALDKKVDDEVNATDRFDEVDEDIYNALKKILNDAWVYHDKYGSYKFNLKIAHNAYNTPEDIAKHIIIWYVSDIVRTTFEGDEPDGFDLDNVETLLEGNYEGTDPRIFDDSELDGDIRYGYSNLMKRYNAAKFDKQPNQFIVWLINSYAY